MKPAFLNFFRGTIPVFALILIGIFFLLYRAIELPSIEEANSSEGPRKIGVEAPFILHFTQPMRQKSVEMEFSINPKIEGKLIWENGKTLEYHPDQPLKIGENYQITIGSEASSRYGKRFGFDVPVDFIVTGPPFILFAAPSTQEPLPSGESENIPIVGPEQPVTVMFDRPMDWSTIEESDLFSTTPQVPGKIIFLSTSTFQFIPEQWPMGHTFVLKVRAGLPSQNGEKTETGLEWSIRTPSLRIVESSIAPEASNALNAPLVLTFNMPVDLNQVKPGKNAMLFPSNDLDADINLKQDGFFNADVTYGTDDEGKKNERQLVFTPTFPYQPETDYRFLLSTDFPDLEEPFELNFKTVAQEKVLSKTSTAPLKWQPDQNWHTLTPEDSPVWKLRAGKAEKLEIRMCQVPPDHFIRINETGVWNEFTCEGPLKMVESSESDAEIKITPKELFEEIWGEGMYFLSAQTEEGERAFKVFSISSTTLILKKSPQDMLVWAMDLTTGKPVARMELSVYDFSGNQLSTGVTDGSGLYKLSDKLPVGIYVLGEKNLEDDKRWTLVHEYWPLTDEDGDDHGIIPEVYLVADTNHVLPEESLNLKGVWRIQSQSLFMIPENEASVKITLENKGMTLLEKEVPMRKNGSFDAALTIPKDAPFGTYNLNVYDASGYALHHTAFPVRVAPKNPPFSLGWVGLKTLFYSGEVPLFRVQALYSNGFSATSVKGKWNLTKKEKPEIIASGVLDFSADGKGKIVIDQVDGIKTFLSPDAYKLTVIGQDQSGGQVIISSPFVVEQGEHRLELNVKHHLISMGEEAEAQVTPVTTEGIFLPRKKVTLKLIGGVEGREKDWLEESVIAETQPTSIFFTPPPTMPHGIYKLVAESKDEKGRTVTAETEVYLLDKERGAIKNTLSLFADQPDYWVGGKARIIINHPTASPESPVAALITYERSQILGYDFVSLQAPLTPIDFPITAGMLPGIQISIITLEKQAGNILHDRANLSLDIHDPEKNILIEMNITPPMPSPGNEVKIQFRTHDIQNRPIRSVITLNVANHPSPTLMTAYFWGKRALEVITAGNMGKIGANLPHFTTLSESLTSLLPDVDSIHFNPLILTDDQGMGEASFVLPKNVADWNLNAFATSGKDHFGSKTLPLPIKKRLNIVPTPPSFITLGDEMVISAAVENLSEETIQTSVELLAEDLKVKGGNKRNLSLKPGENTTLYWEIVVEPFDDIDKVKMTFRSREDYVERTLPVNRPPTILSILPENFMGIGESIFSDIGSVRFSLGTTPLNLASDYAKMMEGSSYPFTETLVSKIIVSESDNPTTSGLIDELGERQQPDGGYTLWKEGDVSNPWLSAHIFFALNLAREKGYDLPSEILVHLTSFLWQSLGSESLTLDERLLILWSLSEGRQFDTKTTLTLFKERGEASFSGKVFLLMTLHHLMEAGQESVHPFHERLLSEMAEEKNTYGSGIYFRNDKSPLFTSDTVNTALMLFALNETGKENEMIPGILKHLLSTKTPSSHSTNSQELIWLVLALKQYVSTQESSPDLTAKVKLNQETMLAASFDAKSVDKIYEVILPLTKIKNLERTNQMKLEKNGKGEVFAGARLTYYPEGAKMEAIEKNALITRTYYDPKTGQPVSKMKRGETVIGEIRIVLPQDLTHVAVEEPLPAGLKAIHFSDELGHPTLGHQREMDAKKQGINWIENPLWYFNQTEILDDRLLLYAENLPAGVYTIRYTAQVGLIGSFNQFPAFIKPLHRSDIYGQTKGERVEVTE